MSGPNYTKGVNGRLAVDRYQYDNHIKGVDQKHSDDQITLSSVLTDLNADNVHEALVGINNKLLNFDYFVTVGEGYDVYASGVFDDSVPNLNTALYDLFYNTNNANYNRLRNGGVVVIKSGTYKISQTVDIPPGITIMGEGFGSKLINTGTDNVMFRVKADIDRYEDRAVVSADTTYDPFLTSKSVRFYNFVISDNYVKPKFTGDTSYRSANNKNKPLVYIENGAGLICEGVVFFGRSASGDTANTTLSAIETDPLSSSGYSTSLSITNCEFDGFNKIISYLPSNGNEDYLVFKNNKTRSFCTTSGNGTPFELYPCNATVTGNYFWLATDVSAVIKIVGAAGAAPSNLQDKSRINIANNTLAIKKGFNVSSTVTVFDPGISNPFNWMNYVVSNNTFDGTVGLSSTYLTTGSLARKIEVTDSAVYLGDILSASSSSLIFGKAALTSFGLTNASGTFLNATSSAITLGNSSIGAVTLNTSYGNILSNSTTSITLGNSSTTSLALGGSSVSSLTLTGSSGTLLNGTSNSYTLGNSGTTTVNIRNSVGSLVSAATSSIIIGNSSVSVLNLNSSDGYIFSSSTGSITLGTSSTTNFTAGGSSVTSLTLNAGAGQISLTGGQIINIKEISGTYTVGATDYVLIVDTSSSTATINLPAIVNGRTLIIKDKGNAATNNITLVRNGGTGQIEGVSSSYIMDADFQEITLVATTSTSPNGWWFVS